MCVRARLVLVPALLLLSSPSLSQGLLHVSIVPSSPLFALGSRSELVCVVQGCSGSGSGSGSGPGSGSGSRHAIISWAPLDDRPLTGSISSNASHSTVTFDPVRREHEGALLCKVTCGGEKRQSVTRVQVYALPSTPLVFSPVSGLVSGPVSVLASVQSSLVCEVRDMYPPEFLNLVWIRDNRTLVQTNADSGSTVVRSQLDFTPQRLDQDQDQDLEFVCRAWMDLPQLSPDLTTRETRVQVQLLFPPSGVSLLVHPEQVLEGRGLTLTCQSDGAPPPTLVLSRNGVELHREDATHFLSFNLSSAQLQDSAHYQCESTNEHGAARDAHNVTVRAHPLQVSVLQQVTAADSGSSLVLMCETQGCSQTPVLTWTKTGPEPDQDHGPVLLRTRDQAGSRLVLQALEVQDSGVYICEAQCDSVARSGRTHVHVYSFPSDPLLSSSPPLVVGGESFLSSSSSSSSPPLVMGRESFFFCSVLGVFPASRLRLQWLMGNESVQIQTGFPRKDSVQNVTSELRLDPSRIQDLLQTYRDQRQDQSQDQRPDQIYRDQILEQTPVVRLSCRVELLTEEGEVWRSRTTSTDVNIEFPPSTVSLLVRPEQVLEGRGLTLTCQSDGAPPPTLVLSRNGAELHREDAAHFLSFNLSSAQLQDSAHYQCESTNEHGAAQDTHNVTVRAPPRITSVRISPSASVYVGQNVTILCSSVCVPPPSVSLTKLTNGTQRLSADGTFLLINVSAQDSGLYQVNVSNELGYEVQVFYISVRDLSSSPVPSLDLSLVLVSCLCVSVGVVSVALLLEYVRRARKKGSYQLTRSEPESQVHT